MRVRNQRFMLLVFLIVIPVASAQQTAPDRIVESIERDGCVGVESENERS